MTVRKLIRDGKTAVLISEGFGAGWSTWNRDSAAMLFDPEIAQMIEDEEPHSKIEKLAAVKYPGAYLGGLSDVVVKWLPEGTQFIVDDYDGNESLVIQFETDWMVA